MPPLFHRRSRPQRWHLTPPHGAPCGFHIAAGTRVHRHWWLFVPFKGPNNELPVVSTRQASTTVRIKDGNSVVIGGLLSEDKTTLITKVPLLGSIPFLGW